MKDQLYLNVCLFIYIHCIKYLICLYILVYCVAYYSRYLDSDVLQRVTGDISMRVTINALKTRPCISISKLPSLYHSSHLHTCYFTHTE